MAYHEDKCLAVIVSKIEDIHKQSEQMTRRRGYIAMLAVDPQYRRLGLGKKLVQISIDAMKEQDADEVVLETEITNEAALRLYEHIGFFRDKRLHSYYLNGNDAYKLKLLLK
mmetsp:Transcript_6281/g.4479  ORF Transcript_6281/g.4479 Transcript_6281/m.4479 type:complete len:112 (-) Transcript_6281:108-443(-)|eukprot:CAMPEP_0116872706 /NCGR_PEP_ID=MMETSP0463-20121206/3531_1 /TAXON_ID=181622 /ORGANISM="Strombidinopsis sp, Strain SopsisLIS2011" /LENGTH=111 /DNA_ID=CAMNT_0004513345 /DNA_START=135 /DNA_END=470 /DNA_ORIENTATION=+